MSKNIDLGNPSKGNNFITDFSQQREQFTDLLIWYKYTVLKDTIKTCEELAEEYINL